MVNIKLENVSKKYGEVDAVNDLTLDIHDGEFLTILGPSGCGKSTIIRMIAGLEEVTSGKVLFDKEIVNEKLPRDRNISMVFQNYALFPHMTVSENIGFPLFAQKKPDDEINNAVNKTSDLLKIKHLLTRKPNELSGGEKQRVALGRAIAKQPSIYLMDEPLSNIDTSLRNDLRAEITQLQKKLKTTLVYVTHDQQEALSMSDRIAVLKDGKVIQVGTPEEIYNHPKTTWIGSFIGNPPMNFLNCKISGSDIVVSDSLKFSIDGNVGQKISNKSNIVVGIRPEDIHTHSSENTVSVN
ncbi:MAG: ABC transporter ATP-binding protein, partial [Thermoproteota archaeon]